MSPVTARMHALLARKLIAACGGLDEAAGACRLNKSRLSECQTPGEEPAFLPADAVADLEAYCGQPIYSRALVDARPAAPDRRDVVERISDAVEDMAELQRLARRLMSTTRPMSINEYRLIAAALLKLREQLGDAMASLDGEGRR